MSADGPTGARRSPKTKSIEELFPWLDLKGISTGDLSEALATLLGAEAKGQFCDDRHPAQDALRAIMYGKDQGIGDTGHVPDDGVLTNAIGVATLANSMARGCWPTWSKGRRSWMGSKKRTPPGEILVHNY
jgi:hypothetical protein